MSGGIVLMSPGKPLKSPSAALKALESGSSVVLLRDGKAQREFNLGNRKGRHNHTSTLERDFKDDTMSGTSQTSRVNFLASVRTALDGGSEVRAIQGTGFGRGKGFPTS